MNKDGSKHDPLVERICAIFSHLYQGGQVDKRWLCERFHITERTAYRDLTRLANQLEETSPGRYQLAKQWRPQLHVNDLSSFATFSDVAHLFPHSEGYQLRDFMESNQNNRIHGHSSRDNTKLADIIQQLNGAIAGQTLVSYRYKGKARQVEPYKLINQSGLWYLAGVENVQLKAFEIAKIEDFIAGDLPFYKKREFIDELENATGIYFGKKQSVTLHVSAKVAEYVTRRPLFPDQQLLSEEADGSLRISTNITDPQHLFRWLRYWLPEITILSPEQLAHDFRRDLEQKFTMVIPDVPL